jgi:methyl-accepting chemotaxis protein
MLAKLSIRAKLLAVVSLLLASLVVMGAFGVMALRSQNAHLVDIQANWLPSVQTLGDLRASTITYRVVARDMIALTDPEARGPRRPSRPSARMSTRLARPTSP